MTAIQNELDRHEKIYSNTIYKIAAEARKKYIIPFCDKTGYCFYAGMGNWLFCDGVESLDCWDKRIPKRVLGALESGILYRQNDLGSLMEDYDPKNKT